MNHNKRSILPSFAIAITLNWLLKIEWWYPYCNDQTDGPGVIVTGMPIPEMVWSGASSLEYNFMPHIHILNLAIISALIFLVLSKILKLAPESSAGTISTLSLVVIAMKSLGISAYMLGGGLKPVTSITDGTFIRYTDLRPASIAFIDAEACQCKKSAYWLDD